MTKKEPAKRVEVDEVAVLEERIKRLREYQQKQRARTKKPDKKKSHP